MTDPSQEVKQTILPQPFTFWFTFFKKNRDRQLEEFEDNLKEIGTITTAEEFWGIYQHMKRPFNLNRGCEFFLFKKEIKPMWEDEANHNGGRFVIQFKKAPQNNKIWEDMLIAFILLDKTKDYLNGLCLNVRNNDNQISLWTKQLTQEQHLHTVDWIKSSIEFSSEVSVEYKNHPTKEELQMKQAGGAKDDEEPKGKPMAEAEETKVTLVRRGQHSDSP